MIIQSKNGFTLIELILVIVILGLLTAVALPRYVNLKNEARDVAFERLGVALLTAANNAHLKQITSGLGPNASVDINGQAIEMFNGYPTDASIGLLLDYSGFTYQPTSGWFIWDAKGDNYCRHDYNYAGWSGNPTTDKPNVVTTTHGC